MKCPSCHIKLVYVDEEEAWFHAEEPGRMCQFPTRWLWHVVGPQSAPATADVALAHIEVGVKIIADAVSMLRKSSGEHH